MSLESAAVHIWFRALGRLTDAGLPLEGALRRLATAAPTARLRRASAQLGSAVESGASLSDAMAREGRLFPPTVLVALRAAEPVGGLRVALEAASDVHSMDAASRDALRGVWLYGVVLSAMLGVFVGSAPLIDLVNGNALWPEDPWGILVPTGVLYGLVAVLVLGGLHSLVSRRPLGVTLDRVKLAIPVLGESLRLALLSPALTLFGLLLARGVDLDTALRDTGRSIPNDYLRRELAGLAELPHLGRCTTPALSHLERLALVSAWRRGEAPLGLSDIAESMRIRLGERALALVRSFGPLIVVLIGSILYRIIVSQMAP